MSTAEERLEEAREGATLSRHEREDAVYDLACEAIALLREASTHRRHKFGCAGLRNFERECDCGKWEYDQRVCKFLDGD